MRDIHINVERLLHPIGVNTFLHEYWDKKPLLIERRESDYYTGILSLAEIDSIVAFRQLKYSQLKIARAEEAQPTKVYYVEGDNASDTNRLFHSYAQGDTIALNFVQQYWESAARLCAAFEHFFHFPAGANVYVTPRNAQGFPPHFDSHDIFVLQVSGAKNWRIYPSRQDLPSAIEDNKPVPRENLSEAFWNFRLSAGDLLYLPGGYVHEACTTDVSSVHVTVGIRPYKWTDLIGAALAVATEEDVKLRTALPVSFMKSEEAFELMLERLAELVPALASKSRLESGVERLCERLIERKRPLPDAHFCSLDQLDEIGLDTIVAKREGMMCHVARKADCVEIAFPGNRMKGPMNFETSFRFIADTDEPFCVSALPDILSDESKTVLARRATREGLLKVLSI